MRTIAWKNTRAAREVQDEEKDEEGEGKEDEQEQAGMREKQLQNDDIEENFILIIRVGMVKDIWSTGLSVFCATDQQRLLFPRLDLLLLVLPQAGTISALLR